MVVPESTRHFNAQNHASHTFRHWAARTGDSKSGRCVSATGPANAATQRHSNALGPLRPTAWQVDVLNRMGDASSCDARWANSVHGWHSASPPCEPRLPAFQRRLAGEMETAVLEPWCVKSVGAGRKRLPHDSH